MHYDLKVPDVRKGDILSSQYGLKDMIKTVNRALDVLKKMFGLVEFWRMTPFGEHLCKSIFQCRRDVEPERFLASE